MQDTQRAAVMVMKHSKFHVSPGFEMRHQSPMLNGGHFNSYKVTYNDCTLESNMVPRHTCPVCGKTFRASSLLDIHMRVHVGAKPFMCPICNHRATQKGNLKLHMKKHHGQDLPSHIDLVPDSGIWGSFSTNHSLTQDDQEVQGSNKKKLTQAHSSLLNAEVVELIKKCQNNIGQSTMGRITESLKDFVDMAQQKGYNRCTESSNFETLKNANNSSSSSSDAGTLETSSLATKLQGSPDDSMESEQKIPLSERLLASTSYDTANASSEGGSSKQICSCKICGWKTSSSGYLNVHMRKHKSESHTCTICRRAFKETWYLKNHMRSHINDLTVVNTTMTDFTQEVKSTAKVFQNMPSGLESDANLEHSLIDGEGHYSICYKCSQIFSNPEMQQHSEVCACLKPKVKVCKLCKLGDAPPKHIFMESLELVTDFKLEKKLCNPARGFNPIISLATLHSSDRNCNSNKSADPESMEKNSDPRSEIIKHEVDKRDKKQLKALNGVSNNWYSNNANKNVTNERTVLRNNDAVCNTFERLSPDADRRQAIPYRNPTMQSLADIGKSLTAQHELDRWSGEDNENTNEYDQRLYGFYCQFCPKWFKYRSMLSIHMRSHTGERPYKCNYCEYAGTQHNCLKLHLQRHHPKQYLESFYKTPDVNCTKEDLLQEHMLLGQTAKISQAQCPICGRTSPSPGYLKIHMRSHKKTLDHVCHVCGRGFKEYWYLSTHLRTHDRDNTAFAPFKDGSVPKEAPYPVLSQHLASRNSLLSRHQSFPLAKEANSPSHLHLTGTSSWSPLDIHEDTQTCNLDCSITSNSDDTPECSRTSKRKALRPLRHVTEPYSQPATNIRSRKSKPRKFSQGSYLPPAFQNLASNRAEKIEGFVEILQREHMECNNDTSGEEQPLDLRVSTMVPISSADRPSRKETNDEPLNLIIK